MLTWEDCLALCELTEDEIAAIAEHEHVPQMAAAEFGNYLVHSPKGVPMIRRIILDDIAAARRRGDLTHAAKLKLVLRHFVHSHPRGGAGGKVEAAQPGP
jgi:hypothetical protein